MMPAMILQFRLESRESGDSVCFPTTGLYKIIE